MAFQDFIDKYEVEGLGPEFIAAMDNGVGPVLTGAWTSGSPVVGLLGPALALPPGSLIMMPFLELDLTKALAAILPGTPIAPGVLLPISPVAMLGLVTLNPLAPDKAKALANAIVDWAVAQAPPVNLKAAPWPPVFVAA
jgi:hypothetical protein